MGFHMRPRLELEIRFKTDTAGWLGLERFNSRYFLSPRVALGSRAGQRLWFGHRAMLIESVRVEPCEPESRSRTLTVVPLALERSFKKATEMANAFSQCP